MNDPNVKTSWDRHVTDWEKDIWPVMKRHEIGKSEAFLAWMLHRVERGIADLRGDEQRDRNRGEEWNRDNEESEDRANDGD